MLDAILNFFFPTTCVLCSSPVLERKYAAACPPCWGKVEGVPRPFCPRCGFPAPAIEGRCGPCRRNEHPFDFARSAALFNGPMREILHHFKYSGRVSLARPLGALLQSCMRSEPFQSRVVVPVPLHPSRLRQRGFNQAELLAETLGLSVDTRVLRRRKNTPSQTGLSRPQRVFNLAGAFEVRKTAPECVLVVDDVYTTGSTMIEIARTLKRAKVQRVEVLTVARVPQPASGL
jgi:ComF family protein